MPRTAISNRLPKMIIEVEYDCRGKRASKSFTKLYEARSFYVMKFKAGRNPKIKGEKKDETTN